MISNFLTVIFSGVDLCLGGEHSNPESFAKYIVDTLDLVEYPQQIIDFYVLNVSTI